MKKLFYLPCLAVLFACSKNTTSKVKDDVISKTTNDNIFRDPMAFKKFAEDKQSEHLLLKRSLNTQDDESGDYSESTVSPDDGNFDYEEFDNSEVIPSETGDEQFGPNTIDKLYGKLRVEGTTSASYSQRDIIVLSKFKLLVGLIKGTESNPKFGFNYVDVSNDLPLNSKITITGPRMGTISDITSDFQLQYTPVNDGGSYSLLDQTAKETRVYIKTEDGNFRIELGIPGQYPVGFSFGDGETVQSSEYTYTDYDLHYKLYLYSNAFTLDGGAYVRGNLAVGSDNSGTTFTGIHENY